MLKRKAFELAKRFKKENPNLAGRPVRLVVAMGSATTLYEIPAGPHGGMGKPSYITSGSHGNAIITLNAGDVLMIQDIDNGWTSYSSSVVFPHEESAAYAHPEWRPEFTRAEKCASLEWAIANLEIDANDLYWYKNAMEELIAA